MNLKEGIIIGSGFAALIVFMILNVQQSDTSSTPSSVSVSEPIVVEKTQKDYDKKFEELRDLILLNTKSISSLAESINAFEIPSPQVHHSTVVQPSQNPPPLSLPKHEEIELEPMKIVGDDKFPTSREKSSEPDEFEAQIEETLRLNAEASQREIEQLEAEHGEVSFEQMAEIKRRTLQNIEQDLSSFLPEERLRDFSPQQ